MNMVCYTVAEAHAGVCAEQALFYLLEILRAASSLVLPLCSGELGESTSPGSEQRPDGNLIFSFHICFLPFTVAEFHSEPAQWVVFVAPLPNV